MHKQATPVAERLPPSPRLRRTGRVWLYRRPQPVRPKGKRFGYVVSRVRRLL